MDVGLDPTSSSGGANSLCCVMFLHDDTHQGMCEYKNGGSNNQTIRLNHSEIIVVHFFVLFRYHLYFSVII
jgi:hypothetical protein